MTWKNIEKTLDHRYLPSSLQTQRLETRIVADARKLDELELAHCLKLARSRKAIAELESPDLERVPNRMRHLAVQLDVTVTPDTFALFARETKLRYALSVAKKIRAGLAGERTKEKRNEHFDPLKSPESERYIRVPIPAEEYKDSYSHVREYSALNRYMREGGLSAKDLGASVGDIRSLAAQRKK